MQQKNRKITYLAGFLFSLPIALSSYINSSFLASIVGEKIVSLIYILTSIFSIIWLLISSKILEKIGGYRFIISVIFLNSLSFLCLSLAINPYILIISFILNINLNILILFSLDEILKIFSEENSTGKTRGIYLTICNIAWILSQVIYVIFLSNFSYKEIYLTSFFIMFLFLFISYFNFKDLPDPKYDQTKSIRNIITFFKNKNLFRSYNINLILQFFFSTMIIYTPLYLYNHLGFSWREIAQIFTIMLLPFIIIPFQLGKYADKIGERKILIYSFLIMSVSTISLFFIHKHKIWIWALILFLTRIGAASVEDMSDVYFFKHIKSENEEYIGIYRSASPIAYIIAPCVAFFIFNFVPTFNYIYLILGLFMFLGVYISSTIKKSDI